VELQRQLGYDRLLTRLYAHDDGWVIKGAAALIARRISARHTIDLDLLRIRDQQHAERDLRVAASTDLSDWFRFDVALRATPVGTGEGARFKVIAYVGPKPWAAFHVDLISSATAMTGETDVVGTLTGIRMAIDEASQYVVYPLVDHVADKVCAILEVHGEQARPSTRFKDLVDLVVLSDRVELPATGLTRALQSEAARRRLELPDEFVVPDERLWRRGYAAEARRANGLAALDLDAALARVCPFLDPVFAGAAVGTWDAARREWSTEDRTSDVRTR
jgi:hypothetical protein